MTVTTHVSLDAFFHEVVTEALDHRGVDASEHTEFYLVGLLGEFATARISDEPLAVKLAQLPQAPAPEQIATLKQVGDTSLYMTGMFAESFDRKLVNPDYYMGLGSTAYRALAARLAGASAFEEVYSELADKFPGFVDVLRAVRERVNLASSDIAKLYQRYKQTRSAWIESRLRAAGVILATDDTLH